MHIGRAQQGTLQRDRDLLLDLFGGQTRDLRDDLRGDIGDIRVGLYRQLFPAIQPVQGDGNEHQPHDAAALKASLNEPINH